MEHTNSALGGPSTTAASVGAAANHAAQNFSAAAPPDMHHQLNGPPLTSFGLVAGTSAAPSPSCATAGAHCTASLGAVAAAFATAAGITGPHSSTPGSTAAAAGDAAPLPLPSTTAVQPAPHPPAANPSIWSNFAAAAADPAFFSHLSSLMAQHQQQQHQQPGFSTDPLSTGLNTNIDHTAPPSSFAGTCACTGINTTAPAAAAPAGSQLHHLVSLPGSPSFPHSPLSGSLSNAAAAAAAAFSIASLGTSSGSEGCDKSCSHCGKVEQRQWRKRGDGTLLCNRCFMWRRNHGGIALPPLDPAPMQPAITKQHSVGARANSSGGGSAHSRHARHSNHGTNQALQDLARLQDSDQEMSQSSHHASGSYSAPSSPARPRSRSGNAASSPARRRQAGSPDDPEYRPRGNSKLNRSTSHASDDYSAAAAAAAGARSSTAGHNMQQQHSKLRPRSRLAKAGGSGAWEDDHLPHEDEADMGRPSDRSAGARQLQHQGSSGRSRLAAAAAAAAAAESDEEVVSAAEVLAGLLPMGCYEADESYAEQHEAATHNDHELAAAAAAAPPPTSIAAHQGVHQPVHQRSAEDAAGNSRATGVVELQRSGPGSIGGSWMGHPSSADDLGKGSMSATVVPWFKCAAAAPTAACNDRLLPQQQGGLSASGILSLAASAKAEQARAAAAAGTINPHVYRAILTALAAGAAAESIDVASTQRKFEVMEQQLHVPHSPAAAHLLSRMHGRSP